jgi:hypothetical protein
VVIILILCEEMGLSLMNIFDEKPSIFMRGEPISSESIRIITSSRKNKSLGVGLKEPGGKTN